jgi:hypothetical protein
LPTPPVPIESWSRTSANAWPMIDRRRSRREEATRQRLTARLAASGQSDECVALGASEAKAVGQELDRIAAGAMDRAALQVADQASADTGAFGQLLLGQVGGDAQRRMVAEDQKRSAFPRLHWFS